MINELQPTLLREYIYFFFQIINDAKGIAGTEPSDEVRNYWITAPGFERNIRFRHQR